MIRDLALECELGAEMADFLTEHGRKPGAEMLSAFLTAFVGAGVALDVPPELLCEMVTLRHGEFIETLRTEINENAELHQAHDNGIGDRQN